MTKKGLLTTCVGSLLPRGPLCYLTLLAYMCSACCKWLKIIQKLQSVGQVDGLRNSVITGRGNSYWLVL